ncbi:MAG: polysaccharide deacetylase family protein [Bacteroidota bacterium]|nr:polysaccharide deacetylase family protein [Bacteroidota bacterium]MDX5426529.1 polysaccharide deacetylase family protein [Bacteroidota bacterium]MDX5449200.1 polysaccharide deacetylase family protein [Bacteroidota bacterium]
MKTIIRGIARDLVFPAITGIGLERIPLSFSRNKLLNLTYHGVTREDSTWFSPRHVQANIFESQIRYIKKNFDILDLKEAFAYKRGEYALKRPSITLTFDDGYLNNKEVVLPILEKYHVPATFFIATEILEDKQFNTLWTDIFAAIRSFAGKEEFSLNDRDFVNLRDCSSGVHLSDHLKKCKPEQRDEHLRYLTTKFNIMKQLENVPIEFWKMMDGETLKEFAKSPLVTIGSHTDRHFNLGLIDEDLANQELKISRRKLENLLDKPIDLIAYPDGSYSSEVKNLAEKNGYLGQLAVNYQLDEDPMDPRIMNRHGVSGTTTLSSTLFFMNLAFVKKGL